MTILDFNSAEGRVCGGQLSIERSLSARARVEEASLKQRRMAEEATTLEPDETRRFLLSLNTRKVDLELGLEL